MGLTIGNAQPDDSLIELQDQLQQASEVCARACERLSLSLSLALSLSLSHTYKYTYTHVHTNTRQPSRAGTLFWCGVLLASTSATCWGGDK